MSSRGRSGSFSRASARFVSGPSVTSTISPGRRRTSSTMTSTPCRSLSGRDGGGRTAWPRPCGPCVSGVVSSCADQRHLATEGDLDVRPPGELQHGPGVDRDLGGVDVARDAGHRDELGVGRRGDVEQGEAVVDAGVDVEDERGPFGHAFDATGPRALAWPSGRRSSMRQASRRRPATRVGVVGPRSTASPASSSAVAGRNVIQRQAVPAHASAIAGPDGVVERRQVAAVARRRRHERADSTARRDQRGHAGHDPLVPTEDAGEQRTPRQDDRDHVGEAGQLGRRRLGRGDDEQGVRRPPLRVGLRGTPGRLDHRRGVGVDADRQGPGLGRGTGQHGPAVTGPEVDDHPLGAGDQVGQLSRRPRPRNADPPRVACRRVYTRSRERRRIRPSPPRATIASPILPPATIGILGGGQLGRMLGLAARAMGYRIAVLDPDPECPAAAVADDLIVGDVRRRRGGPAPRRGERRRHLRARARRGGRRRGARARDPGPARPRAARSSRRIDSPSAGSSRRAGDRRRAVARGPDHRRPARRRLADALGLPLRLKAVTGGYDGRSQVRIAEPAEIDGALERLGREPGDARSSPSGSSTSSWSCRSSSPAAPTARPRPSRSPGTSTTQGILVESVAPAPIARRDRRRGRRPRPPPGRRRWTWSAR